MTAEFLCFRREWRIAAVAAASILALAVTTAFAAAPPREQIPSPPSTFFGSINDSAGMVKAGTPVEAYVGDKLCSKGGKVVHTGEGKAEIAAYAVDVESALQTPGCGTDGAVVTIKIGDRTAKQTGKWSSTGVPVEVDITFGDVTPLPIPTFTPTPKGPRGTPVTIGTQTPQAQKTIPAGSPGAGSVVPGLNGGVTGATGSPVAASANDSGDGFPLWGIVLIVVAALAAVGGGAGYVIARNRASDGDIDGE